MNVRTYLVATGILALAGAATCGGGSSKPTTLADFCSQKAAAECQVSAQCGATLTMMSCETERTNVCMQFAATIQAPRVFVPGNVGACVNQAKSVYAKTTAITPTDLAAVTDKCNYVFQGNVAAKGACTVKYDCTGTQICDKGFCATQMNKNKGDGCSDLGAVCTTGAYCLKDNTTSTYSCVAKGDRGATCGAATPCLENLRCAGGTCTDRVAATGACTTSDDCVSTAPYCDPFAGSTPTCDTGLQFAPGSGSCSGFTTSGVTAGTGIPVGGGGTGGTSGNDAAVSDAGGG